MKRIILLLLTCGLFGTAVFGCRPVMAAAKVSVAQPKLRTAKPDFGKITVTWKKVKKVQGYVVYRKGAGKKKYQKIAVIRSAGTVSYTDTDVKSGRKYTYTVRAVRLVNGKKVFSSYSKEGISAVAKTAAVAVKTATVKNSAIVVRWKKFSGAAGYRIYRKEDKGAYVALADVEKGSATSFKDKTAGMGHVYTYTVSALIRDGSVLNEGEKNRAGVSAQRTIVPPVLTAKAVSGQIYLSWKTQSGAEGYQIYRRESGSKKKTYELLCTTKYGGQRSCWDEEAIPGKKYEYKILAAVKIGKKWVKGSFSAPVSAVCLPATAILTDVTRGETTDTISWHEVSVADGYTVYRKNRDTDNQWVEAASVKSGKNSVSLTRSAGTTHYAVRAWVKGKKKKYLSPSWFSLSNEKKKYTRQKVLFVGDSITWGRKASSGVRAVVPFPERIAQRTGISYVNAGVSGCTLARISEDDTRSVIARTEKGIVTYADYSVIVLEIGTNDYNKNVELGSASDRTDATFCGALKQWFDSVKKENPDAKILVVLPLYRQHWKNDYNRGGWNSKNEKGYSLAQYSDAMKKMAKTCGAEVFDARAKGVLTEKTGELLCDGLHPTEEGYLRLGNALTDPLKRLMTADSVSQ